MLTESETKIFDIVILSMLLLLLLLLLVISRHLKTAVTDPCKLVYSYYPT